MITEPWTSGRALLVLLIFTGFCGGLTLLAMLIESVVDWMRRYGWLRE